MDLYEDIRQHVLTTLPHRPSRLRRCGHHGRCSFERSIHGRTQHSPVVLGKRMALQPSAHHGSHIRIVDGTARCRPRRDGSSSTTPTHWSASGQRKPRSRRHQLDLATALALLLLAHPRGLKRAGGTALFGLYVLFVVVRVSLP
jgi:hypothetical protein